MTPQERHIAAFKICFLEKLARAGVSPGQLGRALKSAGFVKRASIPLVGDLASAGETAAGIVTKVLPLIGGAAGMGGGYLAEHMFGPTEADVAQAKVQQQIDALRRASLRQQATNQNLQEENSGTASPKRRPRLQVSTAV